VQTYKKPFEQQAAIMHFADLVGAGNAITLDSIHAINLLTGADDNAAIIAADPAPLVADQDVIYQRMGGAAGERYRIEVRVVRTLDGQTFQGEEFLDVIAGL
jgi:hypothetical protein